MILSLFSLLEHPLENKAPEYQLSSEVLFMLACVLAENDSFQIQMIQWNAYFLDLFKIFSLISFLISILN